MSASAALSLVLFAATALFGAASAQSDAPLPEELILSLQGGGYVVYIIHAEAEKDIVIAPGASPSARCASPFALTEVGAAKAEAIGGGFERLDIPVTEVVAAACCGAWQMGRNAFAATTISISPEAEALEAARTPSRPDPLMQGPMPIGRPDNLVIIGHAEALSDVIEGVEEMPGTAHLLRNEGGGFVLEGTIPPDAWLGL
ncbi:MAG: hypothetical protein AAF919_13580 [Pseudomonadota bacterium]